MRKPDITTRNHKFKLIESSNVCGSMPIELRYAAHVNKQDTWHLRYHNARKFLYPAFKHPGFHPVNLPWIINNRRAFPNMENFFHG